jgi:predicted dehydrogenase
MADTSTLRVGIVGAGHIGRVQARHWARVAGARVVAVADQKREKAERLASTAGATAYDNAAAMLASDDIDVVIVCVPNYVHASITAKALHAGKHVLVEKPMALTPDECESMIAAAKAADRKLTVGHVTRFFPEYANAKRLVEQGAVGAPAAIRTRRVSAYPPAEWFADPARSGGILVDLVVHDLDWLLWCFGPITRVYAHNLTSKGITGLDYTLLTLRHASGAVAHVEGMWGCPTGFGTAFEIAGDGGLLTHDSRRTPSLTKALRDNGGPANTATLGPLAADDDPYFRQAAAFAASIREGTPVPVPPEEACQAVAVARAARRSAETGKAVEVEA